MPTIECTSTARPALRAAWLHVLLPLAIGSLIYVLARPTGIRVFGWLDSVGLASTVAGARDATRSVVASLPGWLRFSLPNALWVYSFAWLLSALWGHRPTRASIPWLFVAPALGVGWELGQLVGLVPGTFHLLDLALVLAASLLALHRPLAELVPLNLR